MAPEQLNGEWRIFGPWTDLYAVGCVVFELLCGKLAFSAQYLEMYKTLKAGDPPPLPLQHAGLRAWLAQLMDPAPQRRFLCAADAANALAKLTDLPDVPIAPTASSTSMFSGSTLAFPSSTDSIVDDDSTLATIQVQPTASMSRRSPRAALPAIMPEDWRTAQPLWTVSPLAGLGLGIYRLREPALVGREAERDTMWSQLRAVHDDHRGRAILLEGVSGVGKSRLAQWLCERALESGASEVLRVRYSAQHGTMWTDVRRQLGVMGLSGAPLRAALHQRLGAELGEGFTAALSGAQRADQLTWLRRLIATRPRPTIVWLDDAHHSEEALQIATALSGRARCPALVVMTIQSEAVSEAPMLWNQLHTLAETCHINVGPLQPFPQRQLIRRLLRLPKALAGQLEQRAAGNPMFAVQLVGDWIDRGLLRPNEQTGDFALQGNPQIPDTLHAIWQQRILEHVEGAPDQQYALERAAVLGLEGDADEWAGLGARGARRGHIIARMVYPDAG